MLLNFVEYRAQRTNSPPKKPLQFNDLPSEIRDLIWEFSLCSARIFHVKSLSSRDPIRGRIRFHNPHPNPAATQVCTESRRAAWRAGCFIFQHPGAPVVWFNPRSDALYFDRNLREAFPIAEGEGSPRALFTIPGLERVRHVALEWRWFSRDGSKPLEEYSSEEMQSFWAAKTDGLYAYLPGLRTMHYVLPLIRHQGGLPWGREPTFVKDLPMEFVDLPERCMVPLESGFRIWRVVKKELNKTLGAEWQRENKKSKFGEKLEMYPPKVVGERLIRIGAPTTFDHSTIKVFEL